MDTTVMTGKQRILTAMAGGKPDRMPVFVSAHWDYIARAGGGDPVTWIYGSHAEQFDVEMRFAHRHQGADLYRAWGGHVRSRPTDLPPAGPPPWIGYIERYIPEMVQFYEAPADFVHEAADIPRVLGARFNRDRSAANQYLSGLRQALGDEFLVAYDGFGLFPQVRSVLGGFERTMYTMIDSPALVEAVLDGILENYEPMIRDLASAGIDAAFLGAYEEGSDLVQPDMWRRIVYPRHYEFVQLCHAYGVKAIMWFLGGCLPLIEDIARSGYDLLLLEQPRRGYTTDVAEMRRRVGNDLCLSGWVPELAMIDDDREEIACCVEEQIEAAGRDGAFIFNTSYLDSTVNPETVDFLCQKVRECSQ